MLLIFNLKTPFVFPSKPSGWKLNLLLVFGGILNVIIIIERFVPLSPGPNCPMTVDAERLPGATVQVSKYPIFGASNTIYQSGEDKKGRVQHNGEIMS